MMAYFHITLVVLCSTWRPWSNSLSPHIDIKHSPVNGTSPLHIPSQLCAMPISQPSVSNFSPGSNNMPSVPIVDESTSDVPLSSNLIQNPFVPKIEDSCSNSSMYTINSIMNEGASLMNNRTSLRNEPIVTRECTTPIVNETATRKSRNKLSSNIFPSSFKNATSDISWMPSQDSFINEPNIDNWLGQIFKSDNLVAGCSLPQK